MIPQGALELFAQGIAQTLHKKTRQLVGYSITASYFELNFNFKVGAHEQKTVTVRRINLERATSWQHIHDRLVEAVMSQVEPEKGPGFTLDEFGRRHFRMKAETGFLSAFNASEAPSVENH